jgi:hypothetical protein
MVEIDGTPLYAAHGTAASCFVGAEHGAMYLLCRYRVANLVRLFVQDSAYESSHPKHKRAYFSPYLFLNREHYAGCDSRAGTMTFVVAGRRR